MAIPYNPESWKQHLAILPLMQFNVPALAMGDALIVELLCSLLMEEFNSLDDRKDYIRLEEAAGTLMLAFYASTWLCAFYHSRGPFDVFLVPVDKSNAYSQFGRSLDPEAYPWKIATDFVADVTRLRSDAPEEQVIHGLRTFGSECRGRTMANQF